MCINRVQGVRKKEKQGTSSPHEQNEFLLLMNSGGRPGYLHWAKAEAKAMKHVLRKFQAEHCTDGLSS